MKKIATRFGHTILKNGFCTSAPGIKREYELVREYGPLAIIKFQSLGYEVLNVTPAERSYDNEIADINEGIRRANEWGAELFISDHANSFDGVANGCEALYSSSSAKGKELATNICAEIAKLGYYNRGAKVDVRGLNEITRTHMTAIICEPLFCDSKVDMNLYNADDIANAIVKGVTGQSVGNSIHDGWNQINDIWYYYENKIKVINRWIKNGKGLWYLLDSNGAMVTNQWTRSNNKWYWLNENGIMATNKWIKWNGQQFYVDADGIMAANGTTPDGYVVDVHGAWIK